MRFQVCGVCFSYASRKALDHVVLELPAGSFAALVGPNGSGKSTLLKCMCKLLSPSGGAVLVDGIPLSQMSVREVARRVGVVPQEPPQKFDFTVEELVMMGRNPHLGLFAREGPRDYDAVREAMAETGVLHLAGRLMGELSGGELQRVLIARALAQRPCALLLDEPTAHLDLKYQHEIMALLKQINREKGITVLAAIHDLNLAAQHFDEFILMSEGKVYAAGSRKEVITHENLAAVYGEGVVVCAHPVFNWPIVTMNGDGAYDTGHGGSAQRKERVCTALGGANGRPGGVLCHRNGD
ncbi:MAG: ABC transporter ATP-binding protein [Bacillota bacterium]